MVGSSSKRQCPGLARGDGGDRASAPARDHTQLVHNLYRHLLRHHTVPDWQRFEMLVSLATSTFGIDMMPPSYLDDETVVVDRRGYGVDCGIDHINLAKTVVGQSKRPPDGPGVSLVRAACILCSDPRPRPRAGVLLPGRRPAEVRPRGGERGIRQRDAAHEGSRTRLLDHPRTSRVTQCVQGPRLFCALHTLGYGRHQKTSRSIQNVRQFRWDIWDIC